MPRGRWTALCAVLLVSWFDYSALKLGFFGKAGAVSEVYLPDKAVEFVVANLPPDARLFNPFEWGGYMSWRLHTKKPTMATTRKTAMQNDPIDKEMSPNIVLSRSKKRRPKPGSLVKNSVAP